MISEQQRKALEVQCFTSMLIRDNPEIWDWITLVIFSRKLLNEGYKIPASGVLCIQPGCYRLDVWVAPTEFNEFLVMHTAVRVDQQPYTYGYTSLLTLLLISCFWQCLGWGVFSSRSRKYLRLCPSTKTYFIVGLQNLSEFIDKCIHGFICI